MHVSIVSIFFALKNIKDSNYLGMAAHKATCTTIKHFVLDLPCPWPLVWKTILYF